MSAPHDTLAYLTGTYAPVDAERTCESLPIVGELPKELRGCFVQNSSNPRFAPSGPHHWFDGDGMVHALHLEGGQATYRNRWIRTEALAADVAAGRATRSGILGPFDPADPHPDRDTANTDVVVHAGKLLALWWLGGTPMHLAVPSMDTVGPEDFGGTLRCHVAAHPKVDPRTGELVFFDYDPYRPPYLQVGVADAAGRVTSQVKVDLPRPSLFHDIAITERYTILLDFPMYWDAERLAQGRRRVRFDADRPSRYGVLPRHGKAEDLRWFEGPPCYAYHTVNAWEEQTPDGTELVMIGCRIEHPLPGPPSEADAHVPRLTFLRLEPYLHEWRFHLGTGRTTERRLDDVPTEFPRGNDRRLGTKTRYAWHPRVAPEPTLLFDGCIRYDLERGTSSAWSWGAGRFGGETVFAPRPGAVDEDDGWVLAFVNHRATGTSELAVLDGRDVAAGPVARIPLPYRVPTGFHAQWVEIGEDGRLS